MNPVPTQPTPPTDGSDAAAGPVAACGSADSARHQWRPTGLQVGISLASVALAALLLAVFFPKAAGTDWHHTWLAFSQLTWIDIVGMTVIWAIGLWIYTYVYTGSLPGLRNSQALTLNLTGSLVSNLLPFGGAAGVANTYALTFSWGFTGVATSLMVLVSGLANLLIRLLVPLVGLIALRISGHPLPELAKGALLGTLIMLAGAAVLLIAVLASARVAAAVGSMGDKALGRMARVLRRKPPRRRLRADAIDLRQRSVGVIARNWPAICIGMIGYYASETLLFGWAVHALGAPLSWAHIIAAFALSRVLTSVVVTPSGVGISEAGTAAALVLFGVPAPAAAASVLILNFYTYLIELPAGIGGWVMVVAFRRRWRQ